MTNKSEWQEASRRLMAEARERLGDPPTAEELEAYHRGEMTESEEERIRELLVAYPELARMYNAPFPEAPQPGDADSVAERDRRADSQRGRMLFRHFPATIAAAVALVFFGLFVQAENRARNNELPRVLGAPQELEPDGSRGPAAPTILRKDGEAYLLKPRLINQVRYPHYAIELLGRKGAIWTNHTAQPDADDAFQIVIPHDFLAIGETYQLRIFGVDGETRTAVGTYDVAVRAE